MAKRTVLFDSRNVRDARKILSNQEAAPLQSIRAAQNMCEDIRMQLYWIAAIIFGYYKILMIDNVETQLFYAESFWGDRAYTPNINYLMQHICMYVYRSSEGNMGKRAGSHGRALLNIAKEKADMRPEDIPAYLKANGGFEGLRDAAEFAKDEAVDAGGESKALKKAISKRTGDDTTLRNQSEPDGHDSSGSIFDEGTPLEADVGDIEPPKLKTPKAVTTGKDMSTGLLKPIPRLDIFKTHLVLEIDEGERDIILNMKVGSKRGSYEIERLRDSKTFTAMGDTVPLKRFGLTRI